MKKTILLTISLVLFGAVAAYFLFGGEPEALEDNFSETGNLVLDNPGLEPGVPYLIYEEPGSPALSVKLSFREGTSCFVNGQELECSEIEIASGDRVEAKGLEKDGLLNVSSINFLREEEMRQVLLYYYNSGLDEDQEGNILCSRQGVMPLERNIPFTNTPIQDTINLLLKGNLTAEEKSAGFSTEFPLEGLSLQGASLADGVLTLEFDDPNNKTGGGSCRVGILWFQIEATAKQFAGVQQVKFIPEELFQP